MDRDDDNSNRNTNNDITKRRIERKTTTIDNIVSALWSRDIRTIWFGIARTFVSMNKWQIFVSLIAVFLWLCIRQD